MKLEIEPVEWPLQNQSWHTWDREPFESDGSQDGEFNDFDADRQHIAFRNWQWCSPTVLIKHVKLASERD